MSILLSGVACSDGGSEGEVSTSTTATPTETTEDPEVRIRQYASVVAAAEAKLEENGPRCRPLFECAVNVATAWNDMLVDFGGLGERPAEIAPLVEKLEAMDEREVELRGELKTCSDVADNPSLECASESVLVLRFGEDVRTEFAGWRPYL